MTTPYIHAEILSGLDRTWACCQNWWKFSSATSLLCLQNTFLRVINHIWLLQFFCPFFYNDPWALGRGIWYDDPFRNEQSTVSHSLYLDQLWVPVLFAISCKKKVLCWGLRSVLIYGDKEKSFSKLYYVHNASSSLIRFLALIIMPGISFNLWNGPYIQSESDCLLP